MYFSLKNSKLFLLLLFVSAQCPIMHSNPAVIVYPITEWLLPGLTVIACTYLNQPHTLFYDPQQAPQHVQKEAMAYAYRYAELVDNGTIYRQVRTNLPFNPCPPLIMGVRPDEDVYHGVMQNPFSYGPICAAAKVTSTGEIQVVLYIYGFSHAEGQTRFFTWTELGRQWVQRDHELVRVFIDFEDKKQINDIRKYVQSWSQNMVVQLASASANYKEAKDLRARCNISKKEIYKQVFEIYALYHMVQKNISPSLVLYALQHGETAIVGKQQFLIFSDRRYNLAVLIGVDSGDVVDVGYYDERFGYLKLTDPEVVVPDQELEEDEIDDEEEEVNDSDDEEEDEGIKTVEDILEGAEPGKEGGKTIQYIKPGGFDAANEDFDDLQPINVEDKGDGIRVGDLPGGKTVVVRPTSSNMLGDGSFPTLEIRDKNKKEKTIKIRYTSE